MSKLNGMQIFELLSDVNDNLIVESASPTLLAGTHNNRYRSNNGLRL